MDEKVLELINRRELQILVHSFLYYQLDSPILDDFTFDRWSKQLSDLIKEHPDEFKKSEHYKGFIGFDGSTGMDLPFSTPEIQAVGFRLKNYQDRMSQKQ